MWIRGVISCSFCAALILQVRGAAVQRGVRIAKDANERKDLLEHTKEHDQHIIKVTETLYVAVGYALANTIFVLAPDGVIVVDTTETIMSARAILKDFRKLVPDQPIKGIIYTHQHADHNIGTLEFVNGQPVEGIWAHHTTIDEITNNIVTVGPLAYARLCRQYGIHLKRKLLDFDFDSTDLGTRVAMDYMMHNSTPLMLPNKFLTQEAQDIEIAGLQVRLMHIPGETNDHMGVWIPSMGAFLCGDNLYKSLPNLYAIRGTPYRNVLHWVKSLDKIRQLKPEYLLMSHSRPLVGQQHVDEVLTSYRDMIQVIHDQTLRHLNKGAHPGEMSEKISIPKVLLEHPYLQEFYGTIEWSAKAIIEGSMGWFSSYAEELYPLSTAEHAEKMVQLAGGQQRMISRAQDALVVGDYQWALELSSAVFKVNSSNKHALGVRTEALKGLAAAMSSPNGRNYYLTAVLEDKGELALSPNPIQKFASVISLDKLLKSISVWVDGEKCEGVNIKLYFNVTDTRQVFLAHLRNGVLETKLSTKPPVNFDAIVLLHSGIFQEVLSQKNNPITLLHHEDVQLIGHHSFVSTFFECFDIPAWNMN